MSTSKSGIEWTDRTWNPTRGCRRVSPGCENCYAERQAARFCGKGQPYEDFVRLPSTRNGQSTPRWTGEARLIEEALREPLSWRKPAHVFVDSMSDLFYEGFTDEQIAAAFGVMAACPHLTFQVLTKRAKRLPQWFEWMNRRARPDEDDFKATRRFSIEAIECTNCAEDILGRGTVGGILPSVAPWPLPNVWIGVSVEDQPRAEERLPPLLQVPAAVRFVSYEPALGPVDFGPWLPPRRRCYDWNIPGTMVAKGCGWEGTPTRGDACPRCNLPTRSAAIDWLIIGGESGPGARPFDLAWARAAVTQCRAAGVPVFVKQIGALPTTVRRDPRAEGWTGDAIAHGNEETGPLYELKPRDRKGGDPAEWPEDLRVREMPR